MTYIRYTFSPYRGDLAKEIGLILCEDHELVVKKIESRGLLFVIAYILVMSLSVLKVICHIFDHLKKPERPRG